MQSSTGGSAKGLKDVLDFTRLSGIVILILHFYFYCYAAFKQWGLTAEIGDRFLVNIARTGLFHSIFYSKVLAFGLLLISLIGVKGRKDEKLRVRAIFLYLVAGQFIFFFGHVILKADWEIDSEAGKKIKKIKAKWIQTIASLLSLLEEVNPTYQKLVAFLEEDNIELLFTTERTKFSEHQRALILEKMLLRCRAKNVRPVMIFEGRISLFIDGDREAVSLLVNKFNSIGQTAILKVVTCNILCELSSLVGQEKIFLSKALAALGDEKDVYTAGKIVEVMAVFSLGDKSTAEYLVKHPFSDHHEFRRYVYQYLISKKWSDEYYWYGLGGIAALIVHNRDVTRGGAEYWFFQFLLSAKRSHNLRKLIYSLADGNWLSYFDRHSIQQNAILRDVCQIAETDFSNDQTFALALINLLRLLERHKYESVQKIIVDFIEKTKSHFLVVRAVI